MSNLILMQGIPGSGKSTAAKILQQAYTANGKDIEIYSTDDYWYLEDGENYNWDPAQIQQAHKWNQSRVELALAQGSSVIVDNTNIDSFAVGPYFDLAIKWDVPVKVVSIRTPVEECIARQESRPEDRRIPEDVIRKMDAKMQTIDEQAELEKARLRSSLVSL